MEHPWWLRRLREFRHQRLFRHWGLHGRVSVQGGRCATRRADCGRGSHRRLPRLRPGLADPAHARHLLLDRDDCADDHHRNVRDELAFRRGPRPQSDVAGAGDGPIQQLCADAVFRSGAPRGAGGCDIALHSKLVDWPRSAGAQGRRAGRGMHRRADPASKGAGLCRPRRAVVPGRCSRRHVSAVRGSVVGLQSQLLRFGTRHVPDRRDLALGGSGCRRNPAGRDATTADRHHLVGSECAGARRDAGAVRGGRAGGNHWPAPQGRPQSHGGQSMMSPSGPQPPPLLRIDALTKRFGGFIALDTVSVDIRPGERFGLIGPNGSGKTTLINCISGAFRTEAGTVVFDGEDITRLPPHIRTRRGIARSFQIPRPFKSMTVAENLMVALDFASVAGDFVPVAQRRGTVMSILTQTGLASKADLSTLGLSQVELRKMELARAMATHPKLLISDEAMAGLSSSEVDEVLDLLMSLAGQDITVIMIEHIMQAVMRFSERVMCLDPGRIIAIGPPAEVMANQRVQEAYLGT